MLKNFGAGSNKLWSSLSCWYWGECVCVVFVFLYYTLPGVKLAANPPWCTTKSVYMFL